MSKRTATCSPMPDRPDLSAELLHHHGEQLEAALRKPPRVQRPIGDPGTVRGTPSRKTRRQRSWLTEALLSDYENDPLGRDRSSGSRHLLSPRKGWPGGPSQEGVGPRLGQCEHSIGRVACERLRGQGLRSEEAGRDGRTGQRVDRELCGCGQPLLPAQRCEVAA